MKIVIDAGHGAKDNGGLNNNGIVEKDLNLKLSMLIGEKLKNYCDIIYTRTTDVCPSLKERGNIAITNKADLLLSIHFNANDTKARGVEAIVSIKATPDIKIFAEKLCKNISSATSNPYRRVFSKQKSSKEPDIDWYGIPRYSLPVQSIIIESLFMDNKEDIKFLKRPDALCVIANTITNTIIDYYKLQQKNMDYEHSLDFIVLKTGVNKIYWKTKVNIDPYFDDLIIKIANIWKEELIKMGK